MPLSRIQPKTGDILLLCEHLDNIDSNGDVPNYDKPVHWSGWMDDNGNQTTGIFIAPDGTTIEANFMVVCSECDKLEDPLLDKSVRFISTGPVIESLRCN